MATQDERLKSLETLTGNIRERLGKIEGSHESRSAAGPNWYFITFLGFVGTAIIAYLGWLGIQTVDQGKKLSSIEGRLVALGLQVQAALPQPAFEKALPEVRSAIAAAYKDRIPVPPATIEELRSKLLASNSAAPDFWPALSEFVSYRSSLSYHAVGSPVTTAAPVKSIWKASFNPIPDCVDSPPEPMRVVSTTELSKGVYENCRFVLDSAAQAEKLNAILRTTTPVIVFQHCLIEYHGGEIALILAWNNVPFTFVVPPNGPEDKTPPHFYNLTMTGPAIQFENCLFIFTFQNPPPPNGQRLATTLLAGNTDSVSLPIAR